MAAETGPMSGGTGSRPSSSNRRGMQDDKYPSSLTKSRSGSGVPELESVAVTAGGRSASAGRRSASGERTGGRSAAMEEEDEAGMRPSSTGFTHLDEFERKLAEMEVELQEEDGGAEDLSRLHPMDRNGFAILANSLLEANI
jgi:hypothetical protein